MSVIGGIKIKKRLKGGKIHIVMEKAAGKGDYGYFANDQRADHCRCCLLPDGGGKDRRQE